MTSSSSYFFNKTDIEQYLFKHIKIAERKVAGAVGILAKSKHYLPQDLLLQLYQALIECHLIYAIPV